MRVNQAGGLLSPVQRGRPVKINVDGKPTEAYEGETVAAALVAAGIKTFHLSLKTRSPRSMYCGMGACMECLVTVDGRQTVRACMTQVMEGMQVETCKDPDL